MANYSWIVTPDERSGDSVSGELQACILQMVATDGVPFVGRGVVYINQISQRIVGHSDEEIEQAVEILDASYGWIEYRHGEVMVNREKALEEAQRLRNEVYK